MKAGERRRMARKQEKCIALLVAVTALAAGVGNASRVPGTGEEISQNTSVYVVFI